MLFIEVCVVRSLFMLFIEVLLSSLFLCYLYLHIFQTFLHILLGQTNVFYPKIFILSMNLEYFPAFINFYIF
jgi:hypothetical protein